MASTHTSTLDPRMALALRCAEQGDRLGFALAVESVRLEDLDGLQEELNARARTGTVDPLDAAVALFDILAARRQAAPTVRPPTTVDRRRTAL